MSLLVDVVPVAIARLAPDGEPTFINKHMIDLLGLDMAHLTSRVQAARPPAATAVHPNNDRPPRKR